MLHTPAPRSLLDEEGERRMPPGAGLVIAVSVSIPFWVAIYTACTLRF